jgi:simple sugar transport system permease protein
MAQTTVPTSTGAGAPSAPAGGRGLDWRALIERREAAILIVAVILFVYFGIASSNFIGYSNFVTLSQFLAPIAVISAGEVMLLVCAEVDLSAGTTFIMLPFVCKYFADFGFPVLLAIVAALVVAAIIGAVNGLVTVLLDVPSFVTTLGTLFVLDGFMLVTSNAQQYQMVAQSGTLGKVFGIYNWSEILWALLLVIIMYLVLNRTRMGLHATATGGNLLGAAEAGVPVRRVKVWCFMMSAVLAGFIGIVDSVRLGTLDPGNDGTQEMFYAISGAVIGGTALTGGRGTVVGAAVGALVLAVLYDGLTITGVSANTFILILGVAILAAMVVNVQLNRIALRRRRPA